jgi:hypothetical protein
MRRRGSGEAPPDLTSPIEPERGARRRGHLPRGPADLGAGRAEDLLTYWPFSPYPSLGT